MRLETRFALILAFCFCLGVAIAGAISWRLESEHVRQDVRERAEMLLGTGLAVRAYTVADVSPALAASGGDADVFQAAQVPSFAAQRTLALLASSFPEYRYRESSLNPTNVDDRATDWEVGLLRRFQQNPKLGELFGSTDAGDGESYYLARPIRMTSAACLRCHGTPDTAPHAMLTRYGSTNGFGWRLGEVVGLQLAEVPTAPARAKAWSSVLVTVGSLTSVFVLSAVVFLLLLRRHVTNPLDALTRAARAASLDQKPDRLPAIEGQFRQLQEAIERLHHSIDVALRRGRR